MANPYWCWEKIPKKEWKELESFTLEPLGGGANSKGLAVDEGTGDVYVSSIDRGNVENFGLVEVPNVTHCAAGEVTSTTARLEGEVDPLETAGAEYRFEYGLDEKYGSESALTGIAGGVSEPVSAELTGLTPGTTYHCRLDATDTAGLNASSLFNHSPDAQFTTPPLPPEVLEGEALNVTTSGALFRGSVNPGNGSTTYRFEYGRTTSYETELPDITIGFGLEPIPVEQAAEGLEPDTVYHFALVAKNSSGEVVGPDHTFTTPVAVPVPAPGSEAPLEAPVVQGTPVTLSAPATPLLIPTPVFPPVKEPKSKPHKPTKKHKKSKRKPTRRAKRR